MQFLRRAVAVAELDPDMCGFAIVCWDGVGRPTSTMNCTEGPMGRYVAINFVKDVLAQRVFEDDTIDAIFAPKPPPSA